MADGKSYEADWEKTSAAKAALLQKREQMDIEIEVLSKRIDALEVLIGADYPHKGRLVLDNKITPVSSVVNVLKPKVTERVRGLLKAADVPLTTGELHERLKGVGVNLGSQSNPWALIHGICRRLVEQGFAREVDKDGRKAWVEIRPR